MRLEDGGMRRTVWLAGLIAVVAVAGCSRLSFIKPDYSRDEFRRTAPELGVITDDRRSGANSARIAVQQGQLAYTRGDLDAARESADQALKLSPEFAPGHTLRALVADHQGKPKLAGEHYRRAVELAPNEGAVHNNYGAWLCANGDPGDSLRSFELALADASYRTPEAALANAGACAGRAGKSVLAERYLDAALQLSPANPVALEAMARHELDAGRAFHARAFSQRRLAAAPADARSLLLASQIEQELGDNEAAARYVERMRTEFPEGSDSGTGDHGKQ